MNPPSGSASGSSTDPYLSVVVTTRNDDHGGDPLTRLQAFVNCFDEQCRRTRLDAEVIIVEWNPPPERPLVASLLSLPAPSRCTYRFIAVPPELHQQLAFADVLPLFQMIAKNVGIRRARGRFVLATNIDIIFSHELVEYIASGQLQPGFMYRVDRHDIQSALPVYASLDEQMKYCAEHRLRVHARWGSCAVDPDGRPLALLEDIVDGEAVRLGSGWHVREGEASTGFYRWVTGRAQLHLEPGADPSALAGAALEIEIEPNPHDPTSPVHIEIVDGDDRTMARPTITRRGVFRLPLEGGIAARTLELRVLPAPSGVRRPLAVFERRDDMQYVVRSIRLTSLDQLRERGAFAYPSHGWHAMPGATLEHFGDDLSVVSPSRRWSYCLQYGPLRARARGTYRFVVMAEILEGDVSLGVLAGHQRRWLPSSLDHVRTTRGDILAVSVSLKSGDCFWLMLSNDHPQGEAISRFVVKELTGSAEFGAAIAAGSGWGSRRSGERGPEDAGTCSEARATNEPSADLRELAARPGDTLAGGVPARSRRAAQALLVRIEQRRQEKQARLQHALQFTANGWRAGSDGATLHVDNDAGVLVVTERRRWSYCLEYGPLSAPARGTYQFELECQVFEGGARLGILSGDKQSWLRSQATETQTPDRRTLKVSAPLRSGQKFWLMLYNDHPDGEGESRLLVRGVAATVVVSDILSLVGRVTNVFVGHPTTASGRINWRESGRRAGRLLWTVIQTGAIAVGRRSGETVAASGRWLGRLAPVGHIRAAAIRLRDRLRRRIVHSAPEYQAVQDAYRGLEEKVQQLARPGELDRLFTFLQDRRPEALHLNGCGDFQLMAREHWFELRGYPEFHTFSMNIDGLFSSIACYAGIAERALDSPCHIYHLEHEVGSGWSPEGEAVLRRRIAERGITWIDSKDVFVWSAYMHWLRRPMIFNRSDWGFGAFELGERIVEARQDLT